MANAKSKLEIVIDVVTGNSKQKVSELDKAVKGLRSEIPILDKSLSLLSNPLVLVGAGLTAVGAMAVQTTKDLIDYNKKIKDMSTAIGLGADETSRIVQIADDWGIQIGDVRTALGMMTKNGIQPSIENLADLADEFVNTKDKTLFAEKASGLLGRQWQTLIPILAKGGDELRKQAAAVEDGLIVTDQSIKQTEELRLAMDAWDDSVTSIKRNLVTQLLPAMTTIADAMEVGREKGGVLDATYRTVGGGAEFLERREADLAFRMQELNDNIVTSSDVGVKLAEIQRDTMAPAADAAAEANARAAIAISDVTTASLGKDALEKLNQEYKDGAIDADEYRAKSELVMRYMLDLPDNTVDANLALQQINEDYATGKINASDYLLMVEELARRIELLDGQTADTYITVHTQYEDTGFGGTGGVDPHSGQFMGGRQHGGPVMPGGRYTVGEAGPETLIMGRTGGYVIPNTTNNWNLTINEAGRVVDPASAFALMKAMAN